MEPSSTAEAVDIADVTLTSPAELTACIQAWMAEGRRFVTATCIDAGERFEVYYHFDLRGVLSHLLVPVGRDEELPSLSPIHPGAFLVENEIKELFGVHITGLTIDYQGHLLLTEDSDPTPMARGQERAQAAGSPGAPKPVAPKPGA